MEARMSLSVGLEGDMISPSTLLELLMHAVLA